MTTIRLKLEKNETGGGMLCVLKKLDETSYDCLAIAILNEECYKKLEEHEGEYRKI